MKEKEPSLLATPFTPVTCRCPRCGKVYIEWFMSEECEGRTRLWRPQISCDICYAPKCSPKQRAEIMAMCMRRREKMHEAWGKICCTQFLDTLHKEMFKRGTSFYAAHTLPDKSTHSQSLVDYTGN